VAEKLLSEREGEREEVVAWVELEGEVLRPVARVREGEGKGMDKGKGKEVEKAPSVKGKREDLTLARNLALYVLLLTLYFTSRVDR
jgi:hypothetical protein